MSFSELLLGHVNTSDVMSWVRSSMNRAAVTSLPEGRLPVVLPALPTNGSTPREQVPYVQTSRFWVLAGATPPAPMPEMVLGYEPLLSFAYRIMACPS